MTNSTAISPENFNLELNPVMKPKIKKALKKKKFIAWFTSQLFNFACCQPLCPKYQDRQTNPEASSEPLRQGHG